MIALSYAKGSPLLARYLEMNGYLAVQVWKDSAIRWRVMLMNGDTTGGCEAERTTRRDALAIAHQLAEHCGLPFRPIDWEPVTLNDEQKLYVVPCYDMGGSLSGYTCLGYDVAYSKACRVAEWIGEKWPRPEHVGKLAGYLDYLAMMTAGQRHYTKTGKRCEAELHPALIGNEGRRVAVWYGDDEADAERGTVGKSTGWMPCHLLIKTKRSSGGGSIMKSARVKLI